VIDVVAAGLQAAAARSVLAYPLVFAAGALTGVGPCAAPRFVAVAALANAAVRPAVAIVSFVAGLVGASVALGLAGGALGAVLAASGMLYGALAIVLGAAGIVALSRGDAVPHHHDIRVRGSGIGGAFLLGASSALVVAPCCTPVLASIAGLTTAGGPTLGAAALLATFGLGHAAPVVAAGAFGMRIARLLRRLSASQAPALVSGGLMLALAGYYGVLA
jgi:cytochrome c biogenesis protein CcdA